MSIQSLFVSNDASSITRVTINNIIYFIELKYSTREDSWYFTLLDTDKRILIQGVKITFGVPITKHWLNNTMAGEIYLMRTRDSKDKLSRNNFGQGKLFELVYIPDALIE